MENKIPIPTEKMIFEEVVIKLKKEERTALQKIANAINADLGDVIRGHIAFISQQSNYLDKLPEILRISNLLCITRRMQEDQELEKLSIGAIETGLEEKADIVKDEKKWSNHIDKAIAEEIRRK